MTVTTIQADQNTCILAFSGRLNFEARKIFHGSLQEIEKSSPRQIILDLTDISYIDSAGLGLLTLCHKKASAMGSQLLIANPRHTVRDVLHLTKIDQMIPLIDSIDAASHMLLSASTSQK